MCTRSLSMILRRHCQLSNSFQLRCAVCNRCTNARSLDVWQHTRQIERSDTHFERGTPFPLSVCESCCRPPPQSENCNLKRSVCRCKVCVCSCKSVDAAANAAIKGEEDKADRGRGGKTTSGNKQAWSSPSPREQWRTRKNGGNWPLNDL